MLFSSFILWLNVVVMSVKWLSHWWMRFYAQDFARSCGLGCKQAASVWCFHFQKRSSKNPNWAAWDFECFVIWSQQFERSSLFMYFAGSNGGPAHPAAFPPLPQRLCEQAESVAIRGAAWAQHCRDGMSAHLDVLFRLKPPERREGRQHPWDLWSALI